MPSKSGYSDFYRKPLRKAQDYYSNAPTLPTVGGFARMPTSAYADQATQGAPLGSYAREYYRQRYPTQGTVFNPSYGVRAHPVSIGAGLPAAPRPMMPQAPIENSQSARQALTQDQLTQAGAVSTIPASDFYAATGRLGAVVQAGDEQTRPVIMERYRERLAKQKARAGMPVQNPAATMVPVAGGFAMMPNDARGAQLGAELEEIARRRALIQQKAQFETAQREARMAGFTPQASYLLGQGDPNVTNAMMFGPRYAADLAQTGAFNNRTMADYDLGRGDLDLRREESAYGMSPEGQRARERGLAIGAGVPYEQYQPYEDSSGIPGQAGPSMQPQGTPIPREFQGMTPDQIVATAPGMGYTDDQVLSILRQLNPNATLDNPSGRSWADWMESYRRNIPTGGLLGGFGDFLYNNFGRQPPELVGPPSAGQQSPRPALPTPSRSPSDQRRRNRR